MDRQRQEVARLLNMLNLSQHASCYCAFASDSMGTSGGWFCNSTIDLLVHIMANKDGVATEVCLSPCTDRSQV